MKCSNCQASLEADAKFCTSCGTKVEANQTGEQVGATEAATSESNQPNVTPNTDQATSSQNEVQHGPTPTNEFVEQGKDIGKQYWNFLPSALMHPYATSKRMTDSKVDLANAIINIVLFSLFVPLFTYFAARSVSYGFFSPTFTDLVLKPFIVFVIFFAALVGIMFGVAKLMKSPLSYVGVMTRFAALLTLPTVLAAIAMIFCILSAYTFSIFLISIAVALMALASLATVFSIKETTSDGGLDVFYGIVLLYVGIIIFIMIVGDAFVGQLFDLMILW